jgi:hypothetical protein
VCETVRTLCRSGIYHSQPLNGDITMKRRQRIALAVMFGGLSRQAALLILRVTYLFSGQGALLITTSPEHQKDTMHSLKAQDLGAKAFLSDYGLAYAYVAGGMYTGIASTGMVIRMADSILTGSSNQCTVEAGTSSRVKDLLQRMNVQDTAYVPFGDMFEIGSKVQVLKKGLFFPARANKLHDLYRR